MTLEELMLKLTIQVNKQDYEVVVPIDREGDIDEVDTMYPVRSLTYDVAEKRVILEW
jgi:hypothetical protein